MLWVCMINDAKTTHFHGHSFLSHLYEMSRENAFSFFLSLSLFYFEYTKAWMGKNECFSNR